MKVFSLPKGLTGVKGGGAFIILLIALTAVQAWNSANNIQAASGFPMGFNPIVNLTQLPWQARAGFDQRLTNGLAGSPDGLVSLAAPAFPISLNKIFGTAPGSGLHEYMLGTTFQLGPADVSVPLALGLPELGENWAVYLNGQLIRREIYLDAAGKHMLMRRSLQSVVISLPGPLLKAGANQLVFHMIGSAFQVPLFPGWAPGFPLSEGYVVALETDLDGQKIRRNAFSMFQVGAYVFFGLFILLFYANHYQEVSNLFLAWFMLCFGAGWQIFNSAFIFNIYPDTSLITRFSYTATISSGAMAPTIWYFFFPQKRTPWVIWLILAHLSAYIFCTLVVPFEWLEFFLRSYLVTLLPFMLVAVWILIKAWKERAADVGKVSMLVLTGISLAAWSVLDVEVMHAGTNLAPLIPLFFSAVFSIITINRYWRLAGERERIGQELSLRNQELERTHEVLENQVQLRTQELSEEVKRREQLQQIAENRAIEAETLRQAGAAVIETLNQQEMVERILEQLARVVQYDSASVQLKTPDGKFSTIVGGRGFGDMRPVLGRQFPLDAGNPSTQVYETLQPFMADREQAEHFHLFHPDFQLMSWLCVPLTYRGEAIGVLTFDSSRPQHFTPRQADLVAAFASSVTLAMHNAQVYEEARRGAEELSMFYDIGLTITAGLDMNSLLEKLYSATCRLAPIDSFYIALVDETNNLVTFPFFISEGEFKHPQSHPISNAPSSMTVWVIQQKKTLYLPDTLNPPAGMTFPIVRTGGQPTRSYVGVPLIAREKVLGVMSPQSKLPNVYTADHIRLFETLANQAVVAIENSRLFQQVQEELRLRQLAEKQLSDSNLVLTAQIEEINKLQEDLRQQAIRDSLTGLFNRRFMEETFTHELARAAREEYSIGVIILDIDKFKLVNDTYGHEAGDTVLVALAKLLTGGLRSSDTACRYGGEEFLLILPTSTLSSTRRRAEDLRKAVEAMQVSYHEIQLQITVSMGISAFPDHGREMDVLVRQADNNLYSAKNTGRNQVIG